MKEKLYLVTKSKSCYGNVLAYNTKTSEYVYFHFGKEIWREKGSNELFNYFNEVRSDNGCSDEEVINGFSIYQKYSKSCEQF